MSNRSATMDQRVPVERPKHSLVYRIGKQLRHRISAVVARSSLVGNQPVLDPALFPWIASLEARLPEIQRELLAVLRELPDVPALASISPDHRRIAPPGKWKSFFLYGYGYRADENCRRCPLTAGLVEQIPGLNSAFFSILTPGAHIRRHRGVTKAILTAHLPLKVPTDAAACRMKLDEQLVVWTEGRTLVFDDTFRHEVWNEAPEERIVLLIQFRRPTRWLGRLVGGLFLFAVRHSSFVRDARRKLGEWEKAMNALDDPA